MWSTTIMILLLLMIVVPAFVLAEDKCEQRCQRIHQRSLARVGFDDEKLRKLLEKQRPLGTTKDICWRVFDHLDCMKQCNSSPEHEKFDKFVRSKCRFALRGMEDALSCVSRYHSFIEVRCSTFLKEATELKLKSDPTLTPSQQICRYLHLNTLCLENTVTQYCPSAKKYFRRLNFRDYFPNFILPTNDTVFDDVDLDSCQMFDFVKKNNKFTESQLDKELTTVINFLEAKNVATLPPWTTTRSTISDERKEFTSLLEELLEEPSAVPETPTTALSNTSLTTTTESTTATTSSTTLPSTTTSTVPSTTSDTVALMTTSTVEPTSGSSSTTTATTLLPKASLKKGKHPPKSNKALAKKPKTSLKTTMPAPTEQPKTTPSTSVAPDLSIDLSTSPRTTPAEEYGGYEYEEGPGNAGVDMVPIQQLTGQVNHEIDNTDDSATTRKRLFSEDSWEFTPPNFRWSSMRFGNGGVTPLDIDTTTLFGMEEDDSGEDDEKLAMEGDPMQPKKEEKKPKLGKFVLSAHLSSSERKPEDHLEDRETTAQPSKNVTEEAPLEQNLHLPSLSLPEKKPDVPRPRSNRLGAGNEVDNETVPLNPQDNDVQKAEMEILEGTSITPDPEPEELSATKTKDRAFSRLRTSTLRTTSRATMDKPARPTVPVNAWAPTPPTRLTSPHPLLRGEVVVKKIHSWDEVSADYGSYDAEELRENGPMVDEVASSPSENVVGLFATDDDDDGSSKAAAENTTVLPRSVNDRSDRETLVLIYSLLLAVTIFTLMCILICIVWCRKTSAAPVSKPLY